MVAVAMQMVAVAMQMVAVAMQMVAVAMQMVAVAMQMVAVAMQMVAVAMQMVAVAMQMVAVAMQMVAVAMQMVAVAMQMVAVAMQMVAVAMQMNIACRNPLMPFNESPQQEMQPHTVFCSEMIRTECENTRRFRQRIESSFRLVITRHRVTVIIVVNEATLSLAGFGFCRDGSDVFHHCSVIGVH
ncbi:hypothetical protein TanjilG_26929 [Lupinus angustifolius]|uniref:Uncharacterized protein n=1 Tax=Lupinus angustifolius TaxID=3871 RepID=A0A4P1RJ50_LUPAN|nr:hypothetical protein TanjilG_26929 [Lupinus angustifolius]